VMVVTSTDNIKPVRWKVPDAYGESHVCIINEYVVVCDMGPPRQLKVYHYTNGKLAFDMKLDNCQHPYGK